MQKTESSQNKLLLLVGVICLAVAVFLFMARNVLIPFLIAGFLSYIISPVITYLRTFGLKRWAAVCIVFLCLIILAGGIVLIFIPILVNEFNRLTVQGPIYYEYLRDFFTAIIARAETLFPFLQKYNYEEMLQQSAGGSVSQSLQFAFSRIKDVVGVFSVIIVVPVLMFFMLIADEKWINIIINALPASFTETALSIYYEIGFILNAYIRGQIIEALFIGFFVTIAMSILQINFALLIGVGSGLANFVPYFGSIIGTVIACLIGLFQYGDILIVIKIVPCFIIIQFIDNHLIQPLVIGHSVKLSPVLIAFALLAAAQIFGVIGMIFAVPATAIFKSIFYLILRKYREARIP